MNKNCKRREGFKKRGGASDERKMEETEEKYIETKTGRVETNGFTDRIQVKKNNCVKINEKEFWNGFF